MLFKNEELFFELQQNIVSATKLDTDVLVIVQNVNTNIYHLIQIFILFVAGLFLAVHIMQFGVF